MRRVLLLAAAAVACALTTAAPASAQTAQTRVIGGSQVDGSSYPFQVDLEISKTFFCGGVIVDPTHVVTAAHCVTAQSKPHTQVAASAVKVFYGSDTLADQDKVDVAEVAVPDPYTATVNADTSYDVAVLRLPAPLDLSGPNAQAIPIAHPSQPKDLGTAIVSGWGGTREGGAVTSTLRAVRVPLRSDATCLGHYPAAPSAQKELYYASARAVCAGGGTKATGNPDTCQGDSGGPLVVDVDEDPAVEEFVLMGITSFGDGCGRTWPGVYTSLQSSAIQSFVTANASPTISTDFDADGDTSSGIPGAKQTVINPVTDSPATVSPVAPLPTAALPAAPRDATRPTVAYSKLSCTRRHRCTFRLRAGDKSGALKSFVASASRKVRTCTKRRHGHRRRCRTSTRRTSLKTARASGGFTAVGTLTPASYTLTTYVIDASGNRSNTLTKTVRVPR